MTDQPTLSKSTFLKGDQCSKRLYLSAYNRDLKSPPTDQQQAIFAAGIEVGDLARDLFPGGINCRSEEQNELTVQLETTKKAIEDGATVLYEAAFVFDEVFVAVDILVKKGEVWNAYEVKSTTSIKKNHIRDVAVQYYVLNGAGISIERFMLVHMNNKYVKSGNINLKKLFKQVNILAKAKAQTTELPYEIKAQKKILKMKSVPNIEIGAQCKSPYPCPFIAHCWSEVPSPSVMDLTHAGKKAWVWWNKGIRHLKDIPKSEGLSKSQSMQIDVAISGKPFVNVKGIRLFLKTLKYPLMHLDFETVNPAIPRFKDTKPFQALVFQYSLHIQNTVGAEAEHHEFIAPIGKDPRKPLLDKLLADTQGEGDILVYNIHFERSVLSDLAKTFPKHKKEIDQRISRLKDLMEPFNERFYMDPAMNGLTSIKSVLPALVPELSYSDLEIKEGGTASMTYMLMMNENFEGDRASTIDALLAYCKMDTWAMVKILEKLQSVVRIQG
jgi:hypothetical protein